MHLVGRRAAGAASVVAVVALLLAGCGQADPAPAVPGTPSAGGSSNTAGSPSTDGQAADGEQDGVALPGGHVHGVAVNPADGHVYLATHEGLFRMSQLSERVGPVIDLMGFTVAGPDHFYASGHPGPGSDLPNPVGLIESRDGGRTWASLSRQGKSDFHTLAASDAGVIAFDGTLRASSDGTTWTTLTPPVDPFALAASPDGRVVLATSQSGPVRSTDGGSSWQRIAGAPLLQLVDWADAADLAVGVTPDGQIAVSSDAGATWKVTGRVDGPPHALSASGDAATSLRVLVVSDTALLDSDDSGATFTRFRPDA